MVNRYNLPYFQAFFCQSLSAENISRATIKNYRSDLKHFTHWYCREYFRGYSIDQVDTSIYWSLSPEAINAYVAYLQARDVPIKTINRRLSTIRKFCSFCVNQGLLTINPAYEIANVSATANIQNVLESFSIELHGGNVPKQIILSDIKEFL